MDGAFCFQNNTHLSQLINEVTNVTNTLDIASHRPMVSSLLRQAIQQIDAMPLGNVETNEHGYSRQMVYADPAGRFSVIALNWQPGACTPIHGHNAWGCVGVLTGEIGCETYEHKDGGCPEGYQPDVPLDVSILRSTGKAVAGPGTVATVEPDPCGIHRIFNPTDTSSTTLHIYGMDLAANPDGLNKWYEH